MADKQEIILMYIRDGKSQRQINRETGVSRKTIKRYLNEYESKLSELKESTKGDEVTKTNLIDELVKKPRYNTGIRCKRVLTEEVIDRIKFYLKENELKRLNGLSKQQKKKKDIHEALEKEGYNISYVSVAQEIARIEKRNKEAYIRQEYAPGESVEFDWGTVKIYVGSDKLQEFQMAVFASAYGNNRWARLFPKQDTHCFLEAHALYFEDINGVYRTVVYDNTRVAVKRFVGRCEKEATEELLKLSIYYRFHFRFCNAYSGNEKGHVERSVEVVRRKAFANRLYFDSIDEANRYLQDVCRELNNKPQESYNNRTAAQLLEEERENLLPPMPKYETARVEDFRVDKYSTVIIDSCHYSVPDSYVNCLVRCKIYSTKILVFYENTQIAEHDKIQGFNLWKVRIEDYAYTLTRKPKALIHSTILKQLDDRIKQIYELYYHNHEREFIELIQVIGDFGIDDVEKAISVLTQISPTDITTDKIKFIVNRKEGDIDYNKYFKNKDSDIVNNSVYMLNCYTEMLSDLCKVKEAQIYE